MNTFVCPSCGHENPHDPWVESAHCSKCGYRPRPRGRATRNQPHTYGQSSTPDGSSLGWDGVSNPDATFSLPKRQNQVLLKDIFRALLRGIDWKRVGIFAAIALAFGGLISYGTRTYLDRFGLASKPVTVMFLLTLLGLYLMIDGLRIVLSQGGWVRPARHAFQKVYVTGIAAVFHGLFRMFVGLVIFVVGNPLTLAIFTYVAIYIMTMIE